MPSSRILAMLAVVSLVLICDSGAAPAVGKARQYIPSLPGYVPVYIRAGDTPLEDINPDLAEAFNSYAQKHGRLLFARARNVLSDDRIIDVAATSPKKDDISLVGLDEDLTIDEDNSVASTTNISVTESQHIQKIPRH